MTGDMRKWCKCIDLLLYLRGAGIMLTSVFKVSGKKISKCRLTRQPLLFVTGVFLAVGSIQTPYAADPLLGAKSYQSHCINCHGANGAGEIPNVPDFSRGERLLQPDDVLVETIKSGKGMMPAYRGVFTDDEIRDLIAYVRTLRR